MIPRVTSGDTTSFDMNTGYPLHDTISCEITEERNGDYCMKMVVSSDDEYADRITEQSIIVALCPISAGTASRWQGFDVRRITRESDKRITVEAEHVSRRLNRVYFPHYSNEREGGWTIQRALQTVFAQSAPQSVMAPFTITSNIDRKISERYFSVDPKCISVMSVLQGVEGSFVDKYGGELEFINFAVSYREKRGKDYGFRIQYGTNAASIKKEIDMTDVYTGVYGYWYGADGSVANTNTFVNMSNASAPVYAQNHERFPFERIMILDTTEQLTASDAIHYPAKIREAVQNYVDSHDISSPKVRIDVDYVALDKASGSDYVEAFKFLKLCDTVYVVLEKLNMEVKATVVKTVYNVLAERYSKMVIGNYREGFIEKLIATEKKVANKIAAKKSL